MSEESRPSAPATEPAADPVVGRVRALLDLAARHALAELQVEAGDFKLHLRTHPNGAGRPGLEALPAVAGPGEPTVAPVAPDEALVITAPMIGTFYAAPAPDEPPFVAVGDRIEVGQTVAIIEAMKIMNEIQSDQAGVLVEALARNTQPVEFGQPLFRLRPD